MTISAREISATHIYMLSATAKVEDGSTQIGNDRDTSVNHVNGTSFFFFCAPGYLNTKSRHDTLGQVKQQFQGKRSENTDSQHAHFSSVMNVSSKASREAAGRPIEFNSNCENQTIT
jgi:hypothetical protein